MHDNSSLCLCYFFLLLVHDNSSVCLCYLLLITFILRTIIQACAFVAKNKRNTTIQQNQVGQTISMISRQACKFGNVRGCRRFALQLVSVSRMPRKHTVTYIGGSPVAFRSTPEFSGMLRNNHGAADDICYMLSLHANSTDQLQRETPVAPCIAELVRLSEHHAIIRFT